MRTKDALKTKFFRILTYIDALLFFLTTISFVFIIKQLFQATSVEFNLVFMTRVSVIPSQSFERKLWDNSW